MHLPIDGVRLSFIQLQHAETENALMIGIPDKKILITQDLVYHRVHAFIAERAFDMWLAGLHYYEQLPFAHVLPGHGAPGGPELYEQMSHYLVTARTLLSNSTDGDDLKGKLIAAFPDFTGIAMLDHQRRFLFPPGRDKP